MNNILVRPLITEKMTNISADQAGKYGFLVSPKANKIERTRMPVQARVLTGSSEIERNRFISVQIKSNIVQ